MQSSSLEPFLILGQHIVGQCGSGIYELAVIKVVHEDIDPEIALRHQIVAAGLFDPLRLVVLTLFFCQGHRSHPSILSSCPWTPMCSPPAWLCAHCAGPCLNLPLPASSCRSGSSGCNRCAGR